MNGLGKPFRKKSYQKIEETVKIKVKLPHVNKKPLARKRIFDQTQFSHSTLNLKRKNFTPQNHSLFRSTSCLGVTKIMKMCEQILKKNIAGRIPETARSRNLTILTNQMHQQHITNRQTV